MKTLKINLKYLYKSPWLSITFIPALIISLLPLMSCREKLYLYAENTLSVNVLLAAVIPIVSVSVLRKTMGIEASLVSYKRLLAAKYVSVVIFTFSAGIFPCLCLAVYGAILKVPFTLTFGYILHTLLNTLSQALFLTALSFAAASAVKNKFAYNLSLVLSFFFTSFPQGYFASEHRSMLDNNCLRAVLNLFNLTIDETFRMRDSGLGAPINNMETILSVIIVSVIGAAVFVLTVLMIGLIKEPDKIKPVVYSVFWGAIFAVSVRQMFIYYLDNSTVTNDYTEREVYPEKVDAYIDDSGTAQVDEYALDVTIGNTLKCFGTMKVKNHLQKPLSLKLDKVFNIEELTVNGEKALFDRTGDYITLESYADSDKEIEIGFKYNGRVNYCDSLYIKNTHSDIFTAYLQEMFAWYPKILTVSNNTKKSFTIDIKPNNTFICSLNGCKLMENKRTNIAGKAVDVFIFSGYICEKSYKGKTVIFPLEFINREDSFENICQRTIEPVLNYEEDVFPSFILWPENIQTDEELDANRAKYLISNEQIDSLDTFLFLPVTYNGGKEYVWETSYICSDITV